MSLNQISMRPRHLPQLLLVLILLSASTAGADDRVTLYEKRYFSQRGQVLVLDLDDYSDGQLHNLHHKGFGDLLSSLEWTLGPGVRVEFYEHEYGGGRKYVVSKSGEDGNTDEQGFGNRASSWKWTRKR